MTPNPEPASGETIEALIDRALDGIRQDRIELHAGKWGDGIVGTVEAKALLVAGFRAALAAAEARGLERVLAKATQGLPLHINTTEHWASGWARGVQDLSDAIRALTPEGT